MTTRRLKACVINDTQLSWHNQTCRRSLDGNFGYVNGENVEASIEEETQNWQKLPLWSRGTTPHMHYDTGLLSSGEWSRVFHRLTCQVEVAYEWVAGISLQPGSHWCARKGLVDRAFPHSLSPVIADGCFCWRIDGVYVQCVWIFMRWKGWEAPVGTRTRIRLVVNIREALGSIGV